MPCCMLEGFGELCYVHSCNLTSFGYTLFLLCCSSKEHIFIMSSWDCDPKLLSFVAMYCDYHCHNHKVPELKFVFAMSSFD